MFGDARGFFLESWKRLRRASSAIDAEFVQDNHSRSRGAACCAACTTRSGSRRASSCAWSRARCSTSPSTCAAARRPSAAGSASRSPRRISACCGSRPASRTASWSSPTSADFLYKTTDYYYPEHERTLLWNDPALAIEWPLVEAPTLAAKDAAGTLLKDAEVFPVRHHPADGCRGSGRRGTGAAARAAGGTSSQPVEVRSTSPTWTRSRRRWRRPRSSSMPRHTPRSIAAETDRDRAFAINAIAPGSARGGGEAGERACWCTIRPTTYSTEQRGTARMRRTRHGAAVGLRRKQARKRAADRGERARAIVFRTSWV